MVVGLVDNEPPWMRLARLELGTAEVDGPKSNTRILGYQAYTRSGPRGDNDPWCSDFVCAMFERVDIASTRSAAARSWQTWGHEVAVPVVGAVVVLWRETPSSNKGHVGFYVGQDQAGRVLLLGGNQGNRVSVHPYRKARVLSYRWPELS